MLFVLMCCGSHFSFACGESWHDPVKCKWLKKWIKKCDDDSETSNWIAANTKVSCMDFIMQHIASQSPF